MREQEPRLFFLGLTSRASCLAGCGFAAAGGLVLAIAGSTVLFGRAGAGSECEGGAGHDQSDDAIHSAVGLEDTAETQTVSLRLPNYLEER